MAVLTDQQRIDVRRSFSQALSDIFEPLGLTKAEIKAAVNATDQWISDNKAAFNAALPEPAKSLLNASQKTRMFTLVAEKRFMEDA